MKKELRIVFMGTPDFAVPSLAVLLENNYNVVGVVTVPDKPAGRGQKIRQSPVKLYAESKNIPVLQPEKLKDPEFINQLKNLKANLQVVVAFRMLPEIVWNMPQYGTFNLHASLLPKYRGAAPINWAIINGEKETGVTTFFLQHQIDTGDIIFQEKVPISHTDTAGTLHDKLMVTGSNLVLKTVKAIETNTIITKKQDDSQACDAPKIFKQDCLLNWHNTTENIYNKIRGLSPYPSAFTYFQEKNGKKRMVKMYFAEKINTPIQPKPGKIMSDNKTYIYIGTSNGWLNITELQLEGKKRMKIKDFLNGVNMDKYEPKIVH